MSNGNKEFWFHILFHKGMHRLAFDKFCQAKPPSLDKSEAKLFKVLLDEGLRFNLYPETHIIILLSATHRRQKVALDPINVYPWPISKGPCAKEYLKNFPFSEKFTEEAGKEFQEKLAATLNTRNWVMVIQPDSWKRPKLRT